MSAPDFKGRWVKKFPQIPADLTVRAADVADDGTVAVGAEICLLAADWTHWDRDQLHWSFFLVDGPGVLDTLFASMRQTTFSQLQFGDREAVLAVLKSVRGEKLAPVLIVEFDIIDDEWTRLRHEQTVIDHEIAARNLSRRCLPVEMQSWVDSWDARAAAINERYRRICEPDPSRG